VRVWVSDEAWAGGRLQAGDVRSLPPAAARHLQVLRAQPGDRIECFDGAGAAWMATVVAIQRQAVIVRLEAPAPPAVTEPSFAATLAVVMPANDRMDFLVEKATELGVARLQPLVSQRSVLRLAGDRAERKVAHWHAVAAAAAEQCGRRVVPAVDPVRPLVDWLRDIARDDNPRWMLDFDADAAAAASTVPPPGSRPCVLSGPEGGLAPDERHQARAAGFRPVSLGPRVLRADTAPLAWLAHAVLAASDSASR
jgi:16S rRNA (uracil1498-N3)-methyltransferase